MFHFIKYSFLAVFLFAVLNLFQSNMAVEVSLHFKIPWLIDLTFKPVPFNYLALVSFISGIIFAALIGAFKASAQKRKIKKLKELEEEVIELRAYKTTHQINPNHEHADIEL